MLSIGYHVVEARQRGALSRRFPHGSCDDGAATICPQRARTLIATVRPMTRREETPTKSTPASNEVASQRARSQAKHDEKRVRFDALADDEPQICRGID